MAREDINIGVNLKTDADIGAATSKFQQLKQQISHIFKGGVPPAIAGGGIAAAAMTRTTAAGAIPVGGTGAGGMGPKGGPGMFAPSPNNPALKTQQENTDAVKRFDDTMKRTNDQAKKKFEQDDKTKDDEKKTKDEQKRETVHREEGNRKHFKALEHVGRGLEHFSRDFSRGLESAALKVINIGQTIGSGNLVGGMAQTVGGVGSAMSGAIQGVGGLVTGVSKGVGGMLEGIPYVGAVLGGAVSGIGSLVGGIVSALGPLINLPMQLQSALMQMRQGFFQQYAQSIGSFPGIASAVGGPAWKQAKAGGEFAMGRQEYGQLMATSARTMGDQSMVGMMAKYQRAWGMDPSALGQMGQSRQMYGGGAPQSLEKTFARGQELGWKGILAQQFVQGVETGTKKALAGGHVMTSEDMEKMYSVWVNFANLPTFKGELGMQMAENIAEAFAKAPELQTPADIAKFRAVQMGMTAETGQQAGLWDVWTRMEDMTAENQRFMMKSLYEYISKAVITPDPQKQEQQRILMFYETMKGQMKSLTQAAEVWRALGQTGGEPPAMGAKLGEAESTEGRLGKVMGSQELQFAQKEREKNERLIEEGEKLEEVIRKYEEQMWSIYRAMEPLAPNLDRLNDQIAELITSDGFRKMVEIAVKVTEGLTDLAMGAMKGAEKLLNEFAPAIDSFIDNMGKWFKDGGAAIEKFVGELGGELKSTFESVKNVINDFKRVTEAEGVGGKVTALTQAGPERRAGATGSTPAERAKSMLEIGRKLRSELQELRRRREAGEEVEVPEETRKKISAMQEWQSSEELFGGHIGEGFADAYLRYASLVNSIFLGGGKVRTNLEAVDRFVRFLENNPELTNLMPPETEGTKTTGLQHGGLIQRPLSLQDAAGNTLKLAEQEPEYVIPRSKLRQTMGWAEQSYDFSRGGALGQQAISMREPVQALLTNFQESLQGMAKSPVYVPRIGEVNVTTRNYLDTKFNIKLEIEAKERQSPVNPVSSPR